MASMTSRNQSRDGLQGQYFDNANLTKLKLTRSDAGVNFNWGRRAPAAAIAADTFSVRWTGQVQPRYSEQYTFSTRSNDGVRLWINGQKLIDHWQSRPTATTQAGTIQLEAGQRYDLRLEYYDNTGGAMAKLFWSSPQQTREIIPASRLFQPSPIPTATLTASNLTQAGNSYEFSVTYRDDRAIKVSTLDSQDIRVTGPNGFNSFAQLVSVDRNRNGTPRQATYRITAPDGSWDSNDNGTYSVNLRRNQVTDTSGTPIQAGRLGRFQVQLANNGPLPTIQLARYAGGLQNPTDIVSAKDGSNRLYVLEQAGTIRTIANGTVQPSAFLDISDRVKSGGEEGLLSLAFPPDYASKRHFYVYYTNRSSDIVISRFRLQPGTNQADANSETILLTIPHPNFTNHNGGKLAFGPDGFLYIGVGDGGGAGDPNNNAQNPRSLLGKILRLDVEAPGVATYTIPSTNPFLAQTDPTDRYRDEIWALGLRNPWRISFDRQTNDLYIADVGQSQREEVNFQPANSRGGENYGWNIFEGTQPYSNGNATGLVAPLVEYDRSQGISVTGGYVYRGSEFPALQDIYFYGDFANGKIWGVRRSAGTVQNQLLLDSPYGISTFGEDEQGNLYVADYFNGDIYKLSGS